MTISIIIPVYNVEQYITRCFNSVAVQRYNNSKIECIFIDDRGQDESVAILEKLIADYDGKINFKIVKHRKNRGLSAARNSGVSHSRGEYLYFLDSDDSITENCLQNLSEMVTKYPDVDLVQGTSLSIGLYNIKLKYAIDRSLPEYCNDKDKIGQMFLSRNFFPVTAWNKLFKRSFLVDNNLQYKEGYIHEDEYWNYFSFSHINSIAFCFEPTYNHFEVENSIMTSSSNRSAETWLKIIDDYIHLMPDDIWQRERYNHIFDCGKMLLIKILECEDLKYRSESVIGFQALLDSIKSKNRFSFFHKIIVKALTLNKGIIPLFAIKHWEFTFKHLSRYRLKKREEREAKQIIT